MNNRITKRALFLSFVSMFLCFTMLLGTTYAWFTDNVNSGLNKIVAGNLDVELYYSYDRQNWKTVKDSTEIFDDEALWEPGYTEGKYIKVKNASVNL